MVKVFLSIVKKAWVVDGVPWVCRFSCRFKAEDKPEGGWWGPGGRVRGQRAIVHFNSEL